jgi:hypothetical protein
LPTFSGFTSFGENGFAVGREALGSPSELTRTLLHEIYRLERSSVATGRAIGQADIANETAEVAAFVQRAYPYFE